MTICPICEKGKLKQKMVEYNIGDINIGRFKAQVCDKCNEQWFDEKTAKEIEDIEKKKGLFGLAKQSKVGYSGNSLIIRIPSAIAKFMNLKKEKSITIVPEGKNRLVIEM